MQFKMLYSKRILFILSIGYFCFAAMPTLHGQCLAELDYDNQGLFYFFEDLSDIEAGDTIVSWQWDFGDGESDTIQNPEHRYLFPDIYDVSLTITTSNGCANTTTAQIRNCNINIQVIAGGCQGANQEFAISIRDVYEVVDSVDVYIDDILLNNQRYAIDKILNLNSLIAGDDNVHVLRVESDYSTECSESFFIIPDNCSGTCVLQDVEILVNTSHLIEVRDTVFFPENRIITLGDTVNFTWVAPANSTTSDTMQGPDVWDSGVQFVGAEFQIIPETIGEKRYYSIPRGGPNGEGMSGTIFVNCPPTSGKNMNITVKHSESLNTGFQVAIDDVIIRDSLFQYAASGETFIKFGVAADGLDHKVSIVDVANTNCRVSTIVSAIECEGIQLCNINVDAQQISRCENGEVQVEVNVIGIGESEEGISILQDGAFTLDTLFLDENGRASTIITIPGDGINHRITARDLDRVGCAEDVFIQVTDCDEGCLLSDLNIQTITTDDYRVYIADNGIAADSISVANEKGILLNWVSQQLIGARTANWDTGLRSDGSAYITSIIDETIAVEIYDVNGDVIDNVVLSPVLACDNGKIPVFLSFDDDGGEETGYNIFIDNVLTNTEPIKYSFGKLNFTTLQLIGDDELHDLVVRDAETADCLISLPFFANSCTEYECLLDISVSPQDTCYNDNTKPYDINVFNPNPLPKGFSITKNGAQLGNDEYSYEFDSITTIVDTLLAAATEVTYIVTDLLNPTCADTLTYVSNICVTDCEVSNLSLRLIDSDYLAEFPSTPQAFVGCQSDTTHYVAVTFDEKYSDAESYRIIIDNTNFGLVDYEAGDGQNIAFIPVRGDSALHTIMVVDQMDSGCSIAGNIMTPKCFTECRIFTSNPTLAACDGEITTLSLDLNVEISEAELLIFDNGTAVSYDTAGLTANIDLLADGLVHEIVVQEADNLLCTDTLTVTTNYCLECNLTYELTLQDSCIVGDTLDYSITNISGEGFSFERGTFSQTVPNGATYDFVVFGNGSIANITLSSLTDIFCKEAIVIQTEDCSPVICEVDYTVEVNGLTAVFTDDSFTSEEITSQSWAITGGISVQNTTTFTFNFPEEGIYNVCHTIVTDSCENTICKDIDISPCFDFVADFTFEHQGGGTYQFTNISTGDIENYSYDFGDGSTLSTEQNPLHTYATDGIYEVCLMVENLSLNCADTICQQIDFVSSIINIADKSIRIYPNPVQHNKQVTIESDIQLIGYEFYNTSGILLQAANVYGGADKINIRLQNDPYDGIIIMQLKTAEGMFTKKLLVK